MEPAPRRYLCACCHAPVLICSRCDRGDRYCSDDCAQQRRKCSQHSAAKRYQRSHRGRSKHAQRQRRYRERKRRCSEGFAKKVTHQGSPPRPAAALLIAQTTALQTLQSEQAQPSKSLWQCHFCHSDCGLFVRTGFLRCRIRRPPCLTQKKETHYARDP